MSSDTRLFIVRGLPGSGKTTYARQLVAAGACDSHYETDTYFMHGEEYRFDANKLGEYHAQCLSDVAGALARGERVVVSNTFSRRWEMKPYLDLGFPYEIIETTGDYGSTHGVPGKTIEAMRDRWEAPWLGGVLVLFDLDGTLANIAHRQHFVRNGERRWREFFAACPYDTVNHAVAKAFEAHRRMGHHVWITSGRSDEVKPQTIEWLRRHDLMPDQLIMRHARDHQPDHQLKRRWLNDGTIPKNDVLCVYDDRNSVVDMWRSEGLACFQVAPGDF